MTPATKIMRRILLLPIREAEQRDEAVAFEVGKFKEQVRNTRTISNWIETNAKKIRELNEDLLGKIE